MPNYDYPFNERIRTLLRIEDLFAKVLHNIDANHEVHHHAALLTLLQISDIVDRADLRSELLQELARQKLVMESLKAVSYTHLCCIRRKALNVSKSGSPGPPPTK